MVDNLHANRGDKKEALSLCQEYPLEEGMTTHSSIFASPIYTCRLSKVVKKTAGILCVGRKWLPHLSFIRLMREIENVQRKILEGTESGGSGENSR